MTKDSFNKAATTTAAATRMNERLQGALERLSARHKANEAGQVARVLDRLHRAGDRAEPALRPAGAPSERNPAWLRRAAHYEVKRAHQVRLDKVMFVANQMIEKANGKCKQRDGLER